MPDAKVFLRQQEAVSYVRDIADQVERVLTDAALNRAISFLVTDADYAGHCFDAPLDVLDFTRAIHALFRDKRTLSKVLDGTYVSIDDFDSAF